MIIAGMIGYYLFAIGLIVIVGYMTALGTIRKGKAQTERIIARMQSQMTSTPPLEPHTSTPIPDDDIPVPELRITIKRHPESDAAKLPLIAARVIGEVSKLEQSFGGDGLRYDQSGSVEEPGKLVLRLVPELLDEFTEDRLAKVADELNELVQRVRTNLVREQDGDIRELIDRELNPERSEAMLDLEGATMAAPEG